MSSTMWNQRFFCRAFTTCRWKDRLVRRWMQQPAKLDKACAATTQIVNALYELDYVEPEVFLQGIHHVQMEGSFGPPVDAAACQTGQSLRGHDTDRERSL